MRKSFSILLILLLSFLFRFWNLGGLFWFGIDEEFQAHQAEAILQHFHIIWIGVSAANLNYYLAPGVTYLNTLLFYISNRDPISLAIFSSFFGVITCASVYYIGNKLFNEKVGFIAGILYAGSSLISFYDRRFWNPTFIPFISIWLIYSLIASFKNSRWLIVVGLLIGAAYHSHLSLLLFWPVIFYVVAINLKSKKVLHVIVGLATYLLTTAPLLVFDFVHNFDNFKMPFRVLFGNALTKNTGLNIHLFDYFSSLGRLWFLKVGTNIVEVNSMGLAGTPILGIPLLICFSILVIISSFILFKKEKIIVPTMILIISFSFIFYPFRAYEYYLTSLFPLIILATAVFIAKFPKILIAIILSVFLVSNFFVILSATSEFGIDLRKQIVKDTTNYLTKSNFYLESGGISFGGWRYLFKAYGKTPAKSEEDQMFGWLYPKEIDSSVPDTTVLISYGDVDFKKTDVIEKIIRVGNYRSYIIKSLQTK